MSMLAIACIAFFVAPDYSPALSVLLALREVRAGVPRLATKL